MNEELLRQMVTEAVARRLERRGDAVDGPAVARRAREPLSLRAAARPDGPCLIEPTVQCNHCGYCESHGH